MSTSPVVVSIEFVDSPPDLAAALRSAWALTACHRMARREIRITQHGDGHVACQLSSELGGLLLLATGTGATLEEAVAAGVAKAQERIAEAER